MSKLRWMACNDPAIWGGCVTRRNSGWSRILFQKTSW